LSADTPPYAARPRPTLPPLEAPGRAALKRAWGNQRFTVVLLVVSIALLVLVGLALAERITSDGRVLQGVVVGDVDVSGLTEQEAFAAIQQKATQLDSAPVRVRAGSTELEVDPTALDLHIDAAASVRAAREAGRSHNPLDQLGGTVLRRVRADHIPFVVDVDPDRLDAVLDAWVTRTGKGLVDGGLQFVGTQVVEVAPKTGVGIQRAQAKAQLLAALGRGKSDAGSLRIGPTQPPINAKDVAKAAALARSVLASPVTITVNGTPLLLRPEQVAPTLSTEIAKSKLVLESDPAKLRFALAPQLVPLEIPPKDATFAITGTAVSVVPAITGKLVDLTDVGRQVARGNHLIAAKLGEVQPARTTTWAQKLNITELVSSFTTYYTPGQPRVTNIHRAADTINGAIVPPGDTFSLNAALGQRTAAKGYVSAPQIGADLEDEDAIGGGVSQVSTTVFNATFFGCYQDVTHTVHSLYLSRYPMGREATLQYPSIDNQWKNDSASGVLIRAFYSSGSVTVAYYGNKGGRSCRAEGPHILQTISPETEYVDDPSLPPGQTKVLSHGQNGYVVENFRIISVPGQPDKRERYVEHYSMTKNKIARGTGGAPAPTTPATPATTAAAPPG
jgi:vancomycin resistance protein YoaR